MKPGREANAAAQRRYYRTHRAQCLASSKAWRDRNQAHVKLRAHLWYEKQKRRPDEPTDAELDRRALEMIQHERI
jgi:hypothetical protein